MRNVFKKIRAEKNLTQNEMAAVCGVGRQTICDLEDSVRTVVNKGVLQGVESLGYNPEEVREKYMQQKQQQKQEIIKNLD